MPHYFTFLPNKLKFLLRKIFKGGNYVREYGRYKNKLWGISWHHRHTVMILSSNLQTMWHGGRCVITSWIRFWQVSKNEYLTVSSWSHLLFWPEFLIKDVFFSWPFRILEEFCCRLLTLKGAWSIYLVTFPAGFADVNSGILQDSRKSRRLQLFQS